MKSKCFVGVDTSNYTTSVAICDESGKIIANLKSPLHVAQGARGLRQSDAVFSHTKNLPYLMDQLKIYLKELYESLAIGCSARPRSVEGSYMPCFLSGLVAAHSFAAGTDIPLYEFSHQDGHVRAALYSSGCDLKGDFIAFHVSGGTTEILYVKRSDVGFEVQLIGGSADLNAGQCIDRAGVMMGMQFPCGPEMDKYACENETQLPGIRISVKKFDCNLSGVENLSKKIWESTNDQRIVSAFVFEYIAKTLVKISDNIRERFGDLPIIYAGGVMSSKYISERLKRQNTYFAEPQFSADNAAGVALLCRDKYLRCQNI